jgi:uncharacterized membrane protein SirB2
MANYYLLLKHIHITFAVLTFISFSLRGFWMIRESPLLHRKLIRVLPHVIDTILLISAIAMVFIMHMSPFAQSWLSAKILALLVYIILGTIALKRGPTKPIRIISFVGALLVFSYIVYVAMTKTPIPYVSI